MEAKFPSQTFDIYDMALQSRKRYSLQLPPWEPQIRHLIARINSQMNIFMYREKCYLFKETNSFVVEMDEAGDLPITSLTLEGLALIPSKLSHRSEFS